MPQFLRKLLITIGIISGNRALDAVFGELAKVQDKIIKATDNIQDAIFVRADENDKLRSKIDTNRKGNITDTARITQALAVHSRLSRLVSPDQNDLGL